MSLLTATFEKPKFVIQESMATAMNELVEETQQMLIVWRRKRNRKMIRAENLKAQQIDISDELVQMFHSDQSFSEMNRTVKEIRINRKNGIENTKVSFVTVHFTPFWFMTVHFHKNSFQKTIAKYEEKGLRATNTNVTNMHVSHSQRKQVDSQTQQQMEEQKKLDDLGFEVSHMDMLHNLGWYAA